MSHPGLIVYKPQPRLKAECKRAGVSIIELATFWGVAPSTARQRLAGLSGVTLGDIIRATAYCKKRAAQKQANTQDTTDTTEISIDTTAESTPSDDGKDSTNAAN